MGRLMRWATGATLAIALAAVARPASAFDAFEGSSATSTFGQEVRFTVAWDGAPPDLLELLIRTPGSEGAFVAPVAMSSGGGAVYVWDTSVDFVTPNTLIRYQWRATVDGETTVSEERTIRYEDDRPGLDWRSAELGEATVHWYGDAEAQARRFGEVTADGVAHAEELLGTQLAGPVDVFVYDGRDEFFGALGPGAREWTGAAAFSELRTIFMWLGGGTPDYLERAMAHEVTHVVFYDATDNPYHEPARWLNEGIATWAETDRADSERSIVEMEADAGGLFAFEAITEQFPITDRGGRLSYAQGTTMVDLIVNRYGTDALADIAAAYRDGASDAEALEAGTGIPADELYAAYYADLGVEPPEPIEPDPIPPSNVDRPPAGSVDRGGTEDGVEPPLGDAAPGEEAPAEDDPTLVALVALLIGGAGAAALAVYLSRRARGVTP